MLLAALALACAAPSPDGVGPSLVLGTQTFSPGYRFTKDDALVETARGILAMGSDILKISLAKDYLRQYPGMAERPDLKTLRELAEKHPSYRKALAMPFRHILLWVYPLRGGWWDKGLSPEDAGRTYQEIYDLAAYLLRRFSGSGKTFLLGHWEGDWHLHLDYDPAKDPSDTMIRGMTDWLKVRQTAVEDARRDTPHHGVRVYHYVEVNLVQKAMRGGRTITNDILPVVNPDYVSYSSYDSLLGEGQTLRDHLRRALDYVASKLPPRPEIAGRRVFIGEFGFPAAHHPPDRQARLTRDVCQAALEWGCPYALYWEYHCNEVDKDGKRRGFWLVDDKGVKQPVYHLLAGYLRAARALEDRLRRQLGPAFSHEAFCRDALAALPTAP